MSHLHEGVAAAAAEPQHVFCISSRNLSVQSELPLQDDRAAHRPARPYIKAAQGVASALRSYHAEWTASHQNCEVNLHWAPSVLG